MHLFKQHEVQDYRAVARLIQMIDYGPFFAGSPGALDRVAADNPPRYPPEVYRDLVLEFYRANYFHQKGHRSEVAAAAERHSVFRPAPAGS